MNKALFAALASVALLGASCSVQDFSTVVMDKPTITASLPSVYEASIGEQDITRYYGKYSFRYGRLSENLWDEVVAYKYWNDSYWVASLNEVASQNNIPVDGNTTYTLSIGENVNRFSRLVFYASDGTSVVSYMTGNSASDGYWTFTTPVNAAYMQFGMSSTYGNRYKSDIILVKGSFRPVYQPYGYGFSFDTPVTGAGSCAMDMYWNDGEFMPRNSYLAYNYNDECKLYTEAYKFDFGGDSDLLEEFRALWVGAFASGVNRGFDDFDFDYDDDYLVFIPYVLDYADGAFCEFYIEDRYQAGYEDGYLASSAYEIIKELSRFEFVYYTGSGDDEESHSIVKTDEEARDYLAPYVINGLLSVRSVVADLTDGVSGAHDIVMRFKYSEGKTIEAAPLYIDFEAFTSLVAQEFRTHLAVFSTRVQVNWYVFNADLDVSFQGNLKNYGGGMLSDRYSAYTDIQINYPMPDVGGRLNYIGILSGYSQGYADAMTESGEEIDDLTQRILDLQEDLEQYQGKTYQQIYNLGLQAGLDENAQGAATFNSLFGNILNAPLTILNGLTDISFFGMPILTAILSLLMVAMALFLFKRFK